MRTNREIKPGATGEPMLMLLFAAVVCLLLFLSEHDPHVSLKTDYSGTVVDFVEARSEGNLARKIAYPLMGLIGLALLLRSEDVARGPMRAPALAIVLFFVISVFSVLWGGNAFIILRRVAVLFCLLMAAWGFAARFSLGDLLFGAYCLALAYLGIGIAAEVAHGTFLSGAGGYRFAGTLHPNIQAQSCAILAISGLALSAHARGGKRLLHGLLTVTGLLFLYLTNSRTSFAACMAAVSVLVLLLGEPRVRFLLVSGVLTLLGLVAMVLGERFALLLQSVVFMGRSIESQATLTGRVPMWEHCLAYVAERPFLGHGFNNFWSPEHVQQVSSVQGWVVGAAHSTYIELLLDLGLVGLILYGLIVSTAAWSGLRSFAASGNALFVGAFGLLVFSLFVGLLETFVLFYPNPNTFFLLCLLLHIALWNYGIPGADDANRDVLHG